MAYAGRGFTHVQTFLNILINNAGLICVACGMTCVMLTGGIDISVVSLIAMDCMLLSVGMSQWGMNAVVMCLLVLVIGVALAWSARKFPGGISGDSALYHLHGGYVLCPGYDCGNLR